MSIEILRRQNPWWAELSTINEDPHLSEYDQAIVKWEPPHLHALKLDRDLIYIVHGPRQAGKTTFFQEEKRSALIEVKYQTQINPDNAKALVQQGGGILLTKNHLSFTAEKKILAMPVHYFLAMLEA